MKKKLIKQIGPILREAINADFRKWRKDDKSEVEKMIFSEGCTGIPYNAWVNVYKSFIYDESFPFVRSFKSVYTDRERKQTSSQDIFIEGLEQGDISLKEEGLFEKYNVLHYDNLKEKMKKQESEWESAPERFVAQSRYCLYHNFPLKIPLEEEQEILEKGIDEVLKSNSDDWFIEEDGYDCSAIYLTKNKCKITSTRKAHFRPYRDDLELDGITFQLFIEHNKFFRKRWEYRTNWPSDEKENNKLELVFSGGRTELRNEKYKSLGSKLILDNILIKHPAVHLPI